MQRLGACRPKWPQMCSDEAVPVTFNLILEKRIYISIPATQEQSWGVGEGLAAGALEMALHLPLSLTQHTGLSVRPPALQLTPRNLTHGPLPGNSPFAFSPASPMIDFSLF